MIYFSGFCLQNEQELFSDYLDSSDISVAGFSYGAIKAYEYALNSTKRVDKLILLSPAFFQTKKPSYIRTQLRYYQTDPQTYIKNFLANVVYPATSDISNYLYPQSIDDLRYLLEYRWDKDGLKTLTAKGTIIEVWLGQKDKIIDYQDILGFFQDISQVYLLKDGGHILQI
jgi:pimeloyl-ACP methyl ester carboxylesterase